MSGISKSQWTLTKAIVLVLVLLFAGFLILPALNRTTCGGSERVYDISQVRQVNVMIMSYAIDNQDFGPGLDSRGKVLYPAVEDRYQVMLDGGYGPSDSYVSPYDEKKKWVTGTFSSDHYSYALLQLPETGGRLTGWNLTGASRNSVWVSGRNTGADATTNVESVQTDDVGEWQGPVGWGDGHGTHEKTHLLETRFGWVDTEVNKDDNLFDPAGTDDAYMIYTGE